MSHRHNKRPISEMSTSTATFVDYPKPKQARQWRNDTETQDQNPVLRGRILVAAAIIVSRVPFVSSYLWSNAGFGSLRDIKDLSGVNPRFVPVVIPTFNSRNAVVPSATKFSPDLYVRAAKNLIGRYNTAADYHHAYKIGEVTPLQVAEALHTLILRGKVPKAKYESAFVDSHGADHLAIEAACRSTERWKQGKPLGLLDGVPFAVKDDLNVKGYISHIGLSYQPNLSYQKPALETFHPVRMLEEQGAVMIAKNAMHELGCDTTGCNPAWGTPVNWHNKSYYPGGSSSGAGSSLSAGLIPFALGTDAGGSTRIPPCFNGVYGLKTTHNRTMAVNHTMCVVCPMAATVADLTVAYRVISQPDPEDPVTASFVPSALRNPDAPRYIGIDRAWVECSDEAVVLEFDKCIKYLVEKQGYTVVDIKIPNLKECRLAHGAACLTEMAEQHCSRIGRDAPWLSTVNSATRIMLAVGSQTPSHDYLKYQQMREVLMQHVASIFTKYPGIMIMTPTSPQKGWFRNPGDEAYGVNDANVSLRNMVYVFLANMTGCPALTAPVGFIDPDQGIGQLPIGMMAMGEWGSEESLLAWAKDTETYLNEKYENGRNIPVSWIDIIKYAKERAGWLASSGSGAAKEAAGQALGPS